MLAGVTATLLLACAGAPSTSPSAQPSARSERLTAGFVPGAIEQGYGMPVGFRQLSGSPPLNALSLQNTVLSSLYRLDARYEAVPDLTDGPCRPPGADPKVLRCRLIETTWHDGTPVTADDVAFVYGLWMRLTSSTVGAYPESLTAVNVIDDRTVDFVLSRTDGAFFSDVLTANTWMQPQHVFEAAYADFLGRTSDMSTADLSALADSIDAELAQDPPVCTTRIDEVGALFDRVGIHVYREDFRDSDTGALDACAYMAIASVRVRNIAEAIGAKTLDKAVEDAVLTIDQRPVGAGPYRLVSEDANGIHLEAWPGYRGGAPAATRYLDLVPMHPDGTLLDGGSPDVAQSVQPPPAGSSAPPGMRFTTYAIPGFTELMFNTRTGALFSDRNLRLALQRCIDVERDVDAATSGANDAIYTPVTAGSWAAATDLPKPTRSVPAGKQLIEASGWQLGADGVYAKDGIRLSAEIVLRGTVAPRVKMSDLIVQQAADCGMDLHTAPKDWDAIQEMLQSYPHTIPGGDRPFDLYIGAWLTYTDPHAALEGLETNQISDADHPGNVNIIGFGDPVFDTLVENARGTYDQDERARLYVAAQHELADQLPILFLWAATTTDAISDRLTTIDGPLDLQVPNWGWQPERLIVTQAADGG